MSKRYVVGRVDTPGRSERTHAFEVYETDKKDSQGLPDFEDAIKEAQSMGTNVEFENGNSGNPVHQRPECDKKKRRLSEVVGPLRGPQDPTLTCGVCRFALEKRKPKEAKRDATKKPS